MIEILIQVSVLYLSIYFSTTFYFTSLHLNTNSICTFYSLHCQNRVVTCFNLSDFITRRHDVEINDRKHFFFWCVCIPCRPGRLFISKSTTRKSFNFSELSKDVLCIIDDKNSYFLKTFVLFRACTFSLNQYFYFYQSFFTQVLGASISCCFSEQKHMASLLSAQTQRFGLAGRISDVGYPNPNPNP